MLSFSASRARTPARVLLLLLLIAALLCGRAVAAPPPKATPLADSVDPMIGAVGPGSCMPGPALPHSSIYPSPETLGAPARPNGYAHGRDLVGFAQMHTQGTGGTPSYGNFLVSPQIGLAIDEKDHQSPTENQTAKCYAYAVRLSRYGIDCGVTPTRHAALYRFTFPASKNAHILMDVARKIGRNAALEAGSVTIDPKTGTITGGGTFSGNWAPGPYPLYFCARFSKIAARHGVWSGSELTRQDGVLSATIGERVPLGAYVGFDTAAGEVVQMKIAVSFRSVAQAAKWLDDEIPGWDFDALRARSAAVWERTLGAVQLGADTTPAEKTRFYTALWHAFIQPRDRTGDEPSPSGNEPYWDDHYTLWDTWKTLFPLMCIVQPDMVRDNVRAFIARHKRNGLVGTAFVGGVEYRVGQGGDEVDNIIADAYVKGIKGIDWTAAYGLLRFHAEQGRAEGYRERGWFAIEDKWAADGRMKSGSGTLGFAWNDFAVAQVARGLGKTADAAKYEKRANSWRGVWDAAAADPESGFSGFVRARHADGSFKPTPARRGYNTDFYEGTCWEYSFLPTYDIPGMVEAMGGEATFIRRLRYALDNNLIDFGNEPSFMTIWLFDGVRRPYLCSYWADRLRRRYEGRKLPGDDDSGAMSSLYCFLTAGLYPYTGQDIYYLHGPRIPETTFVLPNGRRFTIRGKNAGPTNLYIQSATLNGKPLDDPWIRHGDIVRGGRLDFVMGPKPSAWGCRGAFDATTAAKEIAGNPAPNP